ncbi:ribose transport system ATP-binding protein [Palleronia aestuarii]|uniref:Ribose transport system ATP-binding protein n=1 Tax=Palleronia aestuarii TaxID=568105 RepID=A0A2W7PW03_9RHOB|nr:sugar ABC transporter ATP-binding protein [Palleronia aestuarii]PZX13769.1 ribose transport system ATP-binding protein [Palleronia aestuarii]
MDESSTPRLEMRGISKTFGAIRALRDVSLSVRGGEVHALMGENGAGKSTLMKILAGALRADSGGEIRIRGEVVQMSNPHEARDRGIAVIYQELALSPNLTVAENIFLGRERTRFGLLDRGAQRRAAAPVLERLGADFTAGTRVMDLSLGQRQMVEIARALESDADIIVMDEPTTALSERESEQLFRLVDRLRDEGIAMIYISHRMDEVYRLSDRCSVLRDGAYIGTLEREELDPDRLVSMMVGREASSFYEKAHRPPSEAPALLEVRDLTDGARVGPCSFDLRAGEVLGVAGLVGSGRTELARLIYGADRATGGSVRLDGELLENRGPRRSLDNGIAYLTEDRKGLGLFLEMPVADNVAMSVLRDRAFAGGVMTPEIAAKMGRDHISSLDIRGAGASTRVGNLSGGNQQKVLLARLLEAAPRVLILDEPTRGVDVGAKSEIYGLIDRLTADGLAVILISSELAEVIGTSDRILVMREGRIAGEVANTRDSPATQEAIMSLSAGPRENKGAAKAHEEETA